MEQSIKFLKWYRKEYDSWHQELKEQKELGEQIGEKRGEKRGKQIGEQRGIEKTKLETAKKMLALNIDIPTIIEVTGLSKKDILKFKK